jgi:hypothetical protein
VSNLAKPKKWAFLEDNYDRFVGDIARWQKVKESITNWREELGYTKKDVADLLAETKRKKAEIEDELEDINFMKEICEQFLVEEMEMGAEQSFRILTPDGEKTCFIDIKPRATVENEADFDAWIEQEGLTKLKRIPWQTINALVKERLENAQSEPPGTKVFYQKTVTMRKV